MSQNSNETNILRLRIEPAEPFKCGEVLSSIDHSKFWYLCMFCGRQIAIDSLDFLDHIAEEIDKLEIKIEPHTELEKLEYDVKMEENEEQEENAIEKIEPRFYSDESLENNVNNCIKIDSDDSVAAEAFAEDNNEHTCDHCDMAFESKSSLLIHKRIHSENDNPENQLISSPRESLESDREESSELNPKKMMKIIIKNTVSKWKCQICNKQLQSQFAFKMHQNTHTGDRPFKCNKCPGAYRHATTLSNHKKQHHTSESSMNKCESCNKEFMSLRRFKEHNCQNNETRDDYGRYECDVCLEVFDKDSQLRHHKINSHAGSLVCDICGKEFKTKKYFLAHKEDVHSDQTYNCDKCEQTFKKRSLLKDHIMRDHIKRYQCSYCMKTFLSSTQVRAHETIHTGTNKQFQCEECGKSFPRNFQLSLHKKYHAQLKEYECDICLKRFNTDRALNSHTPYHTKERNFVCPICSKAFKTPKCLVKHKKIHSKFK